MGQVACLSRMLAWCLLQVPKEVVVATVPLVLTGKGSPAASLLAYQRVLPAILPQPPWPCVPSLSLGPVLLALFQLQTLWAM